MADNRSCCSTADVVSGGIREAVCIDTNRVYDSCADKDCLADMRVYFTDRAQCVIDNATSVRCRSCKIINSFIDVEAIPFNRGYYSVDITFFFKVYLDAYTTPMNPPCTVEGLTSFSKKCILYGSEGNVRIFSSEFSPDEADEQFLPTSANPKAKVQCVDPICLEAKLCRPCDCCECEGCCSAPGCIRRLFDGDFNVASPEKAVRVTLGLFTIVQLERDVQMLIPAYDFCVPEKECCHDMENDPCDAFKQIRFPVNEFFPPTECHHKKNDGCGCGGRERENNCGCGCGCQR